MKVKLSLALACVFLMAGCSDENKVVRGEFLAGCVQGGAPKSICSCMFEKLEEKYSPAQLKELNRPMARPSDSFMRDIKASAQVCVTD
ncbi:hypothetical protein ACSHWC_10475 [Pseudomonas fluorescens]